MKKKMIGLLIISIFAMSSFNIFAKEIIIQLDDTLAWIDGEEHTLPALPEIIDNRTYLPFRFMANNLLDANVNWVAETKEVIIVKEEQEVKVTIDSKEAYINGEKVGLTNPPILIENRTYLPLRAIAELFQIQTDYDETTRSVKLTKPEDPDPDPDNPDLNILDPNKAPIAQFEFEQEEYIEGQTVKAINTSYDEDGDAITSQLWMLNFNDKQTDSKLENLFLKPKAGSYVISLKVKDEKGLWGEWEMKSITIKPNQKPVVTALKTNKTSYAAGEEMNFTYTYDNEPWENITDVRWTYRQINESVNKAVVDKPKFIFYEGEYVVTLELKDEIGNWSDKKEAIITINEKSEQHELEYRFLNGTPGDIIDNFQDFNYRTYDDILIDETTYGAGAFLMSDSPEAVKYNGILYKDTLGGIGRILFYHVNAFTEEEIIQEKKRLVIMAENPTDEPVTFTISNQVIKGPAQDALFVGQQLLYDYLKGGGQTSYTLQPGKKMYIYDSKGKNWKVGDLISGQMNFDIDGELTFTVAAIGNDTEMDAIEELPNLERDVHPRGTYDKTEIYHKIVLTDDEPGKLIIGEKIEEWIVGYDAITGEIARNKSNYGVIYHMEITAKTDTGIILNPRAGGFRGAIKWDGDKTYLAPTKGYFTGHNSKAVMLGVIKAGETRTLEYAIPNGSASPILFGFIPKEHWDQ